MFVPNGTEVFELLREQRIKKGLTLDALSKASGVSRVSINRYELGTRTPNIIIAAKLADALGCKVEDLMPQRGCETPKRTEAR